MLLTRGTAYIKLKQFEKAIQDYNQAIELDPSIPMLLTTVVLILN
ncbi:hypothetical protein BSPWISOXPB_6102 [uncultured Gammaproteobacteria bacterium]|nr:hypothetical protein BSPWISOXPB_6102 [uncultured Gammaproteobacteria bacterium]